MVSSRAFMRAMVMMGAALFGAACGGPHVSGRMALSETVQREAIMQCQAAMGLNQPAAIQAIRLASGGADVYMTNSHGVTMAEARAINRCRTGKLAPMIAAGRASAGDPISAIPSINTRSGTGSVAPAPRAGQPAAPRAAEPVSAGATGRKSAAVKSPATLPRAAAPAMTPGGCAAGGGVFQGGSQLCPGRP